MSYVPKFCECCGDEIAKWNQSGYCSRTEECRRQRQGVSKPLPKLDPRTCLECGEPIKRGISSYCHRTDECVRKYGIEQRARYKRECFEAYGGPKCACCGETRLYFLTLDHKLGGGNKDRQIYDKGNGVYSRLRAAGFPDKDKYQVLCFNCNGAKHFNATCPCSLEREIEDLK